MRILITGGTGSLGQKLVEHFLKKGWHVRVLSRDENKQNLLLRDFPKVKVVLGDVRSFNDCSRAVYGVDVVIHTAALKRIEFGEAFPFEFVKTNTIGTYNVVRACKYYGIKKMVFVSTDKACKPINAYGMTKALAEKIVVNAGFNVVRYGNVNNSRGSVLPYWKQLTEEEKPIPLTAYGMTRFLISFDKAIGLIEKAIQKMEGVVYVPRLNSASVTDLAHVFAKGNKIYLIGERPGEKVHEILIGEDDFRHGKVKALKDYFKIYKKKVSQPIGYEYCSQYHAVKGVELLKEIKEVLPRKR